MITILTLLAVLARAVSSEHYHIVPVDSTALCQHYPNRTCFTLDHFSSQISDTGDTTISFLPGEHLLTWNMTFINRNNIILNSEQLDNLSNSTPRIRCVPNTMIIVKDTDTFTLQELVIYGCNKYYNDDGGVISLLRTTAVIKNTVFRNNSIMCQTVGMYKSYCLHAAALVTNISTVTIDSCVFEYNTAHGYGTGVVATTGGTLHIMSSTFRYNEQTFKYNGPDNRGGTVYADYAVLQITSSTVEHNIGTAVDTAIGSTLNITNSIFQHNKVDGWFIDYKTVTMSDGTISDTVFKHNTGVLLQQLNVFGTVLVIRGSATVHIANSTFEQNNATAVGTFISSSTLHITNSAFQHNTAGHFDTVSMNKGTISDTVFKHNTGKVLWITGMVQKITDSTFEHNTAADSDWCGGAVNVDFSVVCITNSTFEHNTAPYDCGGAVWVNSAVVHIKNSTFSDNKASKGGAVCINSRGVMTLDTVIMSNNKASYDGGALYLEQQSTLNINGDVTITNNCAQQLGGGIFSLQSTINLRNGNARILSNTAQQDGGGIHLTATSFTLGDTDLATLTIDSNTAKNYGGGFYLQDNSLINSDYYYFYYLKNNTALRGGAIYMSDSGSGLIQCSEFDTDLNEAIKSTFKQCFIQQPRAYFENNRAIESGSDIYGGLLDRCVLKYHSKGIDDILESAQFSWAPGGHVHNIDQFHNHISSDPVRVCFCQNDAVNCSYTHPTVFKKKGETFTLSVAAVDQVGKPVNATLFSSLPLSENGRLKAGQHLRHVRDQCTELEYNVYSSDSTALLQIYADGPCGNQGFSKQHVNITFKLCMCPIGLDKTKDPIDCSCDCAKELKPYNISNCSPENKTIQINQNIWIEHINHTNSTKQFVTQTCPFDYCVQKPVSISLTNQTDSDQQCAFNRTGRLCGQCEQGLSVVFATSKCQHCSNYYLFLLLPFALAGIALVAFILLLNITVATGTIHGLIFYANILAANQSIFLPFETENFLTVSISWLNLDLGIETCFYNGMDSYSKFLLQLVFPAYVLLLIAIIIVLCNRSQRIADLFGKKNPEATLYTLILLSYSKLIRIIITALQFTEMDYPDDQKVFWLFDANIPYLKVTHIPRFLVAFIVTILGAVYTTLLLFGQLFNRCYKYRLMKWTTHRYYIHFLKAHHAPLSDKYRYWVGLLLLARLVHYLISAFADNSIVILSASTIAGAFLLLKNNKQIYSKWLIDLLETFFMANLGVFSLSTLYIKVNPQGNQQALAIVSMSVSFIVFLGIVLCRILDTCGVKLGELPNKVLAKLRERQHYQPVAIIEEQLEDDDELLIQLDEVHNYADNDTDDSVNNCNDPARYITPPIIRSAIPADQLREPALDDLIPVQPEDYNIPLVPQPQHREPTFSVINIRARETD